MVALVVVVIDKGADASLTFLRRVVMPEQNDVLKQTMRALDLPPRHRMKRFGANMTGAPFLVKLTHHSCLGQFDGKH